MGAVAPYPMDEATLRRVEEEILGPLVRGLRAEGVVYRGVVYAGLMLTREGPKVLEFNARFGDPEAQALLPLLENDLVELALRVAEGRLAGTRLSWKEGAAACVVLAAPGYPESPRKGIPLHVPEPPEGSWSSTRGRGGKGAPGERRGAGLERGGPGEGPQGGPGAGLRLHPPGGLPRGGVPEGHRPKGPRPAQYLSRAKGRRRQASTTSHSRLSPRSKRRGCILTKTSAVIRASPRAVCRPVAGTPKRWARARRR